MEKFINILLDSMVNHDAESLPMADRYRATENGIPSAVRHMTCWRTITGFSGIAHKLIDEKMQTVVVVAEAVEGDPNVPSLMSARMLIEDEKIKELEVYLLRSRNQAGFWFKPEQLTSLPAGWSTPIPETGRATYDELYALGAAINNMNIKAEYFGSEDCFGMENGGVVYEHIDYMTRMAPPGAPKIDMSIVPPSGRMATPMPMLFPVRPTDLKNRVLAVDVEQGLVACYGTMPGIVSPYIVSDEISTCFVPEGMADMHRNTLTPDLMEGKQLLEEGKATAMATTIVRFHSGRLQGYHQIIVLNGEGYHCPWEKD